MVPEHGHVSVCVYVVLCVVHMLYVCCVCCMYVVCALYVRICVMCICILYCVYLFWENILDGMLFAKYLVPSEETRSTSTR